MVAGCTPLHRPSTPAISGYPAPCAPISWGCDELPATAQCAAHPGFTQDYPVSDPNEGEGRHTAAVTSFPAPVTPGDQEVQSWCHSDLYTTFLMEHRHTSTLLNLLSTSLDVS